MRKILFIIIPVLALAVFFVQAPTPAHAQTAPDGSTCEPSYMVLTTNDNITVGRLLVECFQTNIFGVTEQYAFLDIKTSGGWQTPDSTGHMGTQNQHSVFIPQGKTVSEIWYFSKGNNYIEADFSLYADTGGSSVQMIDCQKSPCTMLYH
jgi:hypothetical protein